MPSVPLWAAPAAVFGLAAGCSDRRAPRPARGPATAAVAAAPAVREEAGEGDSTAPVAVLRGYYAALARRDYARAYAAWGPDGPPGRPTLAAFARGVGTAAVRLTPGQPGPVEGAAGSRYVTIPVEVTCTPAAGPPVTARGTYTLRRTVVPGAVPAARRWHLYRAGSAVRCS